MIPHSLNSYLNAILLFEVIGAIISLGLLWFILWLAYTWVISYRRWAESDIAIRRARAGESAARELKLNAEIALLRHEMSLKGLATEGHDTRHPIPLSAKHDNG